MVQREAKVLAAKTKLIPNLAKTNRHLAKAGLHLLSRVFTNFGWSNHPSSKPIATKERLMIGEMRTANIARAILKNLRRCVWRSPKKDLFPDCAPGTMAPFGDLYGVPTYVDRSLTRQDHIAFEAGTHTDATRLRYSDYEHAAKPYIEDFAVKVHFINKRFLPAPRAHA